MSTAFKDAAGTVRYNKSSGEGTTGDPYITEYKETSAAAILAAVDGIEALETTGNASLVAITGHVDGIETLIGATNTALATTNSTLSTIDGRVDGLETLVGTTNTTLSTIDGRVDGLETLVAATNTALATTNSTLSTIDGRVDGLETLVAATNAALAAAIPAGNNNIGDVDIAEKTLIWVTGTAASSGDQTIIAASGAATAHKIVFFQLQNESAVATTMILKFGAAAKYRALGQNQGDGATFTAPAGRAWSVGNNTALVLNLSGANSCGYTVCYFTE